MPDLTGKVAMVTGASSGIGRATTKLFAEAGASVVLAARSRERLEEVASGLKVESLVVKTDVTVEEDRKKLIKSTIDRFGKLDVMVNAAGIINTGTIDTTSLEDWDRMFEINVRSVFRLMQLALPYLIQTRGSIVNVSSINGLRSFQGVLAYCASKAALDQLTRCASLELASKSVRVNSVNPGVVKTELHRRGGMDEERYSKFLEHSAKNTHPIGRVGEPEEVARLILFLASDEGAWITGVNYVIDGGRANTCFR